MAEFKVPWTTHKMDGFADRVVQLNATNYQRWKFDIETILRSKGCYEIVTGEDRMPTLPTLTDRQEMAAANEALKVWKKMDATAMSIIARSLDEENHSFIRDCQTSKQIWDRLKSLKETTTAANKLLASQEFHSYKWQCGSSVSTFVAGLNVIVQKMKSMGLTVEDTSVSAKIIQCLPSKFDSFRESWRLTATESTTCAHLQSQLVAAEADMAARISEEDYESTEAFRASTSLGENRRGQRNQRPPNQGNNGKNNNQSKDAKTCHHCHKEGHIKAQCWKLHGKPQTSGSFSGNSNRATFMAHSAMFKNQRNDGWLADSGAFRHITRKDWFVSLKKLEPPIGVIVANGKTVYAVAEGKINVEAFDGKQWYEAILQDVLYAPDFGDGNLFSLGASVKQGYSILIDQHETITLSKKGSATLVGYMEGTLFTLMIRRQRKTACSVAEGVSLQTWHERLGHDSRVKIETMISNDLAEGIAIGRKDDFFL